VNQLKDKGRVTRGRIGVQISPVSDDVAKALGLDEAHGALVSKVEPKGPAADAGVRSGDVITEFDGDKVKHMTDLPRLVGDTSPDTKSRLKVWRKGKSVELKVTVEEMPAEDDGQPATHEQPSADAPA